MQIDPGEWLGIIEHEYMQQFITAGGSAVKFVVASSPQDATQVRWDLESIAKDANCQFAHVAAARTRIHMIDQLFHQVARQIDWDQLVHSFARGLLIDEGFSIPDDLEASALTYRRVAEDNQTSEAEVRRALRAQLERRVYKDFAMSQEFRIAMMRLCQAHLEVDAIEQAEKHALHDWLKGELRLISSLKRSLIFQKIARHNARDMLISLTHWLRLAGRGGLVLTLDIRQYLISQRPAEGTLYHTPSVVLDAYEVLRQFVDMTDELEGCLLVVIAPQEFMDDPRRGLERYVPLYTRISDEVQDRYRANPLASLVRMPHRAEAGKPR